MTLIRVSAISGVRWKESKEPKKDTSKKKAKENDNRIQAEEKGEYTPKATEESPEDE